MYDLLSYLPTHILQGSAHTSPNGGDCFLPPVHSPSQQAHAAPCCVDTPTQHFQSPSPLQSLPLQVTMNVLKGAQHSNPAGW